MPTQEERRAATRAAVIEAAMRLFGETGFEKVRVGDIAAEAGVAKGAVYHHFPTKEAIFEAVFEEVAASLARSLVSGAKRAADPLDAIIAGVRGYFKACSEGPTRQIILKDGPAILGWARWRELDQRHFGGTIPQAIELAMGQGIVAQQPLDPLSRLIVGAVTEGAMVVATSNAPSAEIRRYLQAFRELLYGLKVDRN